MAQDRRLKSKLGVFLKFLESRRSRADLSSRTLVLSALLRSPCLFDPRDVFVPGDGVGGLLPTTWESTDPVESRLVVKGTEGVSRAPASTQSLFFPDVPDRPVVPGGFHGESCTPSSSCVPDPRRGDPFRHSTSLVPVLSSSRWLSEAEWRRYRDAI